MVRLKILLVLNVHTAPLTRRRISFRNHPCVLVSVRVRVFALTGHNSKLILVGQIGRKKVAREWL